MQSTENLPLVMDVDDVAEALHLDKRNAQMVMRRADFPSFAVTKRKRRINREAFLRWLEEQSR